MMILMKFLACTAERFFRIDRAQENLHFLTDITADSIFILDQELMILPQTPENDKANCRLPSKKTNFSSGSSDNLERESHENTPTSPNVAQHFFGESSTISICLILSNVIRNNRVTRASYVFA